MEKMMDVPDFEDRKQMWSRLRVTPQVSSPSVDRYVEALKNVYTNGTVRAGTFLVDQDEVFEWYVSRNQVHELGFFEKFWLLGPVANVMPEPLCELNFFTHDVFEQSSPFLLGGSLAWALANGGAYQSHKEETSHAKKLGDELAAAWIDERYDEVLVYESHVAWSEFFLDVAWDHSWVALDKQQRLVHFLCATDTD